MSAVSEGQLTYGHALLELAYFRYHSQRFLKERAPQMEMNRKLDVFSDMLTLVKGDSSGKVAPSRSFYMEEGAERMRRMFGKQMEAMVEEELKKSQHGRDGSDFNNWVLASKEKGDKDSFAEGTNQLLMSNLLQMKRHANVGVRLAKRGHEQAVDAKRRSFILER